jgi:hypothetical protein
LRVGSKPREYREIVVVGIVGVATRAHIQRSPDVDRAGDGIDEPVWHHADDGERRSAQGNRAADR